MPKKNIKKTEKHNLAFNELSLNTFIAKNSKPFSGIADFLVGPTRRNQKLWKKYQKLIKKEAKRDYSEFENKKLALISGLQTEEMNLLCYTGLFTNLSGKKTAGDYCRAAFYGLDYLIAAKKDDLEKLAAAEFGEETIRLREELGEQIKALEETKEMAKADGFDISQAAKNAQEAIWWTYFAFLAGAKEQNGIAINLENVSAFFDCYLENDLQAKIIDEEEAQELVDNFVMKLRLVRNLKIVQESIDGKKPKTTKTTHRFFQALNNFGVLSETNPVASGACNFAKALLLALNEGRDEVEGLKIIEDITPISGKILHYKTVEKNFSVISSFLAREYAKAMSIVNFVDEKYYYERAQMAFVDTGTKKTTTFVLSGFPVVVNSLSAIKFAKVVPIRDERGITVDFEINGDFPKFGSKDKKVEDLALKLAKDFNKELAKHWAHHNTALGLSVLATASNVIAGRNTGATPDGRKAGQIFDFGRK